MRIVVSGTHASGKSTLIADFAAAHPRFEVLGDPFEDVDAALDEPDASTYFAQLRLAAGRLRRVPPSHLVIAERGPLDFLAYLTALSALRRPTRAPGLLGQAAALAADAMAFVDLLVLLPLSAGGIPAPDDEDPLLRAAMNDALLELSDDPDLTGSATVVEIVGDRGSRVAQLAAAVSSTG
jgi:hypothetical protein